MHIAAEGVPHPLEHFLVRNTRYSVHRVLGVDLIFDPGDSRVVLWDFNLEPGLDPVLDSRRPGLVGDRHADRTIEQFLCVETIIYFLVLT